MPGTTRAGRKLWTNYLFFFVILQRCTQKYLVKYIYKNIKYMIYRNLDSLFWAGPPIGGVKIDDFDNQFHSFAYCQHAKFCLKHLKSQERSEVRIQRCVCEIGGVEDRRVPPGHSPAGSRITADVRLTSTDTAPSDTVTAPSAACSSTL